MLSFLQNQLGRRSSARQPAMAYSESTQSILSRTNSATPASHQTSEAPSATPATSNTDEISFSTDATPKQEPSGRSSERLRHARSSIGSYNENVLAGSTKRKPRRQTIDGATRTVSGDTLVEGSDSAQQLLLESEQALNRDWTLGAMPGDDLKLPKQEAGVKRRSSRHLDILGKASGMVENASTVLGKRGRETVDAGMEKIKSLKGNKRSSLRPRKSEIHSFEEPVAKKARFFEAASNSEPVLSPKPERKVMKKPTKRWLSQGLYVGQDRDFDARLTEAKNKMKRVTKRRSNEEGQRSILPLPMFAGQRALENGRNFRLPFDVFFPLPPGQPKPEEWKKTHKNVFVGDAIQYWRKAEKRESSECICKPDSGCDENCLNRIMLYECDSSNCNIGPEYCTNRAFEQLRQRTKAGGKYRIGVEVCKTLDRGYGVRANRTFEPNQIIVEYTGEIITQEECDDRMHKLYKHAKCYYLMDFDQQMILDATRGSIARFVNHSCEPNCRMIKWTVGGKPRMALFAGDKGIMTGEELTYDYNFDPYSVKNVQECRCGSANCRGVLGPKPKEIKDALKPITGGQKRKIKEVVEEAMQRAVNKKRKLPVPVNVKGVLEEVKAKTKVGLTKAKALTGTAAGKERLVKKVSERSLRGVRRATALEKQGEKIKRRTLITYQNRGLSGGPLQRQGTSSIGTFQGRRRSAKGTFMKREEAEKAELEEGETKQESKQSGTPINRRASMKDKAGSVRNNVVRTVRRSSRAGGGKSIRVIGDEGDE